MLQPSLEHRCALAKSSRRYLQLHVVHIYIYMHVDYIIYVYTNTYALCIFNNNHVYNQKIESIWPVGTADAKVLGRHHAHIGL